jgi:hypothetical protein
MAIPRSAENLKFGQRESSGAFALSKFQVFGRVGYKVEVQHFIQFPYLIDLHLNQLIF